MITSILDSNFLHECCQSFVGGFVCIVVVACNFSRYLAKLHFGRLSVVELTVTNIKHVISLSTARVIRISCWLALMTLNLMLEFTVLK